MEDTSEFVAKMNDIKEKEEKNKKHQGKGNQANVLSNKQHSTNK